MPEKVNFPITFEKGLFEHQEESVLAPGYLTALENWIPEPSGALRARRRWTSGGTSGAPATRRTRGIGSIATQESFATPALRQTTYSSLESSAPSKSWSVPTAAGSLLLAALAAKRWIRRIQAPGIVSGSGTSISPSWSQATVSGNCLIAVVAAGTAGPVPTITPPAGWTSRATVSLTGNRLEIFVRENSSVRSGSETFTFSASSSAVAALYEYENVATATAFDQAATASGTTDTASTGTTAAITQRDELFFGTIASPMGFGSELTEDFTTINEDSGLVTAQKIAEATTTANYQRELTSAGTWLGAIITLKANITGPPTITAPGGWTQVATVTRNQIRQSLYYIQDAATRSGSEAFTLTQFSKTDINLMEYSGIALAGALDQSATSSGGSATADTGTTAATTQAQELVVALLFAGQAEQTSPTNGFVLFGGIESRFEAYQKFVTSAGAQNMSATLAGTRDWTGLIATFKAGLATSAGAHYLVADDDGANFDIWRTNSLPAGTWTLLEGNVPATGLDRTSPVAFATGLDRVLWTHKDFTKTRAWDGNVANAPVDVTNAPRGRAMVFYRERFFIGGTKAGAFGANGSTSNVTRLWFCNLGDHTVWGNNDFIDVGRQDGEPIEDVAAVSGGLLIAKRSSLWFLSGTGPDNFQLDELEAGDGYPGRCICVGAHGALVAGERHLWLWSGGVPSVMSDPVMDSYSIGGSFVSTGCVGDVTWVCDTGSGVVWAHDHMANTWWTEKTPAGNDQPAIIHAFEKRLVYGPLASTVVGSLVYRDEPGSTRGRDVGLATTYMAETPELYPGGAGRAITPRHLYLELRQRAGDQNDAGLIVTPIYDGVEQAGQTISPKAQPGIITRRLDIGSVAGIRGIQVRFEQANTTTDDAVMDIERVEFIGLMSPHR